MRAERDRRRGGRVPRSSPGGVHVVGGEGGGPFALDGFNEGTEKIRQLRIMRRRGRGMDGVRVEVLRG